VLNTTIDKNTFIIAKLHNCILNGYSSNYKNVKNVIKRLITNTMWKFKTLSAISICCNQCNLYYVGQLNNNNFNIVQENIINVHDTLSPININNYIFESMPRLATAVSYKMFSM